MSLWHQAGLDTYPEPRVGVQPQGNQSLSGHRLEALLPGDTDLMALSPEDRGLGVQGGRPAEWCQ